MKRYPVVFEESAQTDVRRSYEWGCSAWCKNEAQQWARQLRMAVFQKLAVVPKGFPLAPEDDEFREGIRQMIVGRYRVLFTIKGRKVHVLHIRGASVPLIQLKMRNRPKGLIRSTFARLLPDFLQHIRLSSVALSSEQATSAVRNTVCHFQVQF